MTAFFEFMGRAMQKKEVYFPLLLAYTATFVILANIPEVPLPWRILALFAINGVSFMFVFVIYLKQNPRHGRWLADVVYCHTEREVYEGAIELTQRASQVCVLGPLQTVMTCHQMDTLDAGTAEYRVRYLRTIEESMRRLRVHGINRPCYSRAMNFLPDWEDPENPLLVAENAVFFARLLEEDPNADTLEVLHFPDLPRISGDFHFNTSDTACLIIMGDKGGRLSKGLLIRDTLSARAFVGYYQDTIRPSARRLGIDELKTISDLIRRGMQSPDHRLDAYEFLKSAGATPT